MNRGEITRCVQKLVDWDISKNQKLIFKHLKQLNDALLKYEEHEMRVKQSDVQLKDASEENDEIHKIIEKQLQTVEEQNIEMIRLRQQLKILKKKISHLCNKIVSVPDEDQESAFRKRLCLSLIRICTRVYIDPNTPSHILRGFAAEGFNEDLLPFEYDIRSMPGEEVTSNLWELSRYTGRNSSNWAKLFGG